MSSIDEKAYTESLRILETSIFGRTSLQKKSLSSMDWTLLRGLGVSEGEPRRRMATSIGPIKVVRCGAALDVHCTGSSQSTAQCRFSILTCFETKPDKDAALFLVIEIASSSERRS